MFKLKLIAIGILAFLSSPAFCGPAADGLSKCVVDSSTPDDRVALVQWMFSSMSSHPTLKPLTNISDAQKEQYSHQLLNVFSRLVTVTCLEEAKVAMNTEGPDAVIGSFRSLGQLAAMEILSNPAVQAQTIDSFAKHFDPKMFDSLNK